MGYFKRFVDFSTMGSARPLRRLHNQAIVQTLLILPMVVAGVILIVRNSLALAFSRAGVEVFSVAVSEWTEPLADLAAKDPYCAS